MTPPLKSTQAMRDLVRADCGELDGPLLCILDDLEALLRTMTANPTDIPQMTPRSETHESDRKTGR